MPVPGIMSDEELAILHAADEWRGFVGHPCYEKFVAAIRAHLNEEWMTLLDGDSVRVERSRGFIHALNRVLEIADAEIQSGQRVLEDRRRADLRASEEARAAQSLQRERTERRIRLGATLD